MHLARPLPASCRRSSRIVGQLDHEKARVPALFHPKRQEKRAPSNKSLDPTLLHRTRNRWEHVVGVRSHQSDGTNDDNKNHRQHHRILRDILRFLTDTGFPKNVNHIPPPVGNSRTARDSGGVRDSRPPNCTADCALHLSACQANDFAEKPDWRAFSANRDGQSSHPICWKLGTSNLAESRPASPEESATQTRRIRDPMEWTHPDERMGASLPSR